MGRGRGGLEKDSEAERGFLAKQGGTPNAGERRSRESGGTSTGHEFALSVSGGIGGANGEAARGKTAVKRFCSAPPTFCSCLICAPKPFCAWEDLAATGRSAVVVSPTHFPLDGYFPPSGRRTCAPPVNRDSVVSGGWVGARWSSPIASPRTRLALRQRAQLEVVVGEKVGDFGEHFVARSLDGPGD